MNAVRVLLACLAALLPFGTVHAQYYAVKDSATGGRVEIPAAVVASFNNVFPAVARDTLVRWEVFALPATYYGVTLGKHGAYGKAAFDSVGTVVETVLEVPLHALPKPVQRTVKRKILPWLRQRFPHVTPQLRTYAYTQDAELRYYEIDFINTADPRRSRDWLIQADGSYSPRGSPVFR